MYETCKTCRWAEHLSESGNLPGFVGYDYNCRYDPEYTSVHGAHWCSHWESKTRTDRLRPDVFENCALSEAHKNSIKPGGDEKMNPLQFTCPNCGWHYLVEVNKNVTVSLPIFNIADNHPVVDYYDIDPEADLDFDESTVDHYKCADCGFKLPYIEWEDVIKWIHNNNKERVL